MIVDASALEAIAMDEPDAPRLVAVLLADPAPRISAGNLLETYMVIDRRWHDEAAAVIERVVVPFGLIVEPVTGAQVSIACDAWRRYGRGSGHPARLNVGDCFAYALARERGEPLVFVGGDFTQTDISPVQDADTG